MAKQYSYHAFGSPMLGSTITTAPRRQGDGMDSESLLLQAYRSPELTPTKLAPRHTNLNSTNGSASIDVNRAKKGTFIPKEPVKGAVKQVPKPGDQTQQTKFSTNQQQIRIAPHDPKPGQDNTTHTMPPLKDEYVMCGNPSLKAEVDFESTLMSLGKTATLDDRRVEGQPWSGSIAGDLTREVTDLKSQLETQYKVNTDLKKLLVASMGDDLHHKVDSLIRTRAQLASEIGGYTEKIHQDYETLDKLSIQADMWRSKYMASRVMVDQLADTKDKYTGLYKESKRALQQFLQERTQISESLQQTYRYLKLIRDSFDPRGAAGSPPTIPNILELARTNHLLADSVKFRLLPAMPVFPTALDSGIQNGATPAEKLALQVLANEEETDTKVGGVVTGRLSSNLLNKYNRFHPQVRYDNITFSCCAKCKGDIQVV